MKTPRDILLSKHRGAVPKLDTVRQETVEKLADERNIPSPIGWEREHIEHARAHDDRGGLGRFLDLPGKMWVELILPCRRIWVGLAAVWVILIAFNVSQRSPSHPVMANAPSAAETAAIYRDQQRILNELLADRSLPTVEAVKPRSYRPKPSSEAVESFTV